MLTPEPEYRQRGVMSRSLAMDVLIVSASESTFPSAATGLIDRQLLPPATCWASPKSACCRCKLLFRLVPGAVPGRRGARQPVAAAAAVLRDGLPLANPWPVGGAVERGLWRGGDRRGVARAAIFHPCAGGRGLRLNAVVVWSSLPDGVAAWRNHAWLTPPAPQERGGPLAGRCQSIA